MRIVEIRKNYENGGVKFFAGHQYVLAEDIEAQYRSIHGDALGMSYPIEKVYKPYKGEDLSGKKFMCWRTGGIGDLFFLNPVLRYLKKRYPTCSLYAASACKQPLENLPELDGLYDMPFDASILNNMDFMLQFQGIIEGGSDESKRMHAVDMFFSYFSIDSTHIPPEEKVPRLFFTPVELEWVKTTIRSIGIKDTDYVIGIQMETSSPLRNYPKEKMKIIVDTLAREENVKVVVIGSEQHELLGQFYKGNSSNIIVATKFSVRQSICLATRYNMIISPDSFMVQVAGALDKPLIGIYGPFPSEVRMKYFKNAIGLDTSVVCAPCFKHDFRGCIKGFPSPCFTLITVEDVLQAADCLRHKTNGTHFSYMQNFFVQPNLAEAEKYMLGADRGICFFPGYFQHPNILRVDPNPFVKADISNLAEEIKRESYPFVLYMNEFQPKYQGVYLNSKQLVRPNGFFIVYKRDGIEQLYSEIKRDLGTSNFILLFSKFDPGTREMLIIARKM